MTVEKFVDAHFTFREHPVEFNELLRSLSSEAVVRREQMMEMSA